MSSLPPPLSPPPDCLTKLHEGHRAKGVQQAVQHDAQREVDQAQVGVKHSLHAMHTMGGQPASQSTRPQAAACCVLLRR